MKVYAYGAVHEGTPLEILEQLRRNLGDPDVTDFEGYTRHIQNVFFRFLGIPLDIPEELCLQDEKAAYLLERVRRVGLLEVIEDA